MKELDPPTKNVCHHRLLWHFRYLAAPILIAAPTCLRATEPEVVELTLDGEFENALNKNRPSDKWPAWIVNVQQEGGQFRKQPSCWNVDESQPVGYGRLSVTLNRDMMKEDVALAILYEGNQRTDIAVQLFDADGRVVVLDLFGNLVEVGRDAKTDTFIVPLRKYPTATTISIRRISGDVKLFGLALYPVVGEAQGDKEALEQLAKLLGDPLSPENPLVKSIQKIARRTELPVNWPQKPPITNNRTERQPAEIAGHHRRAFPAGLAAYWDFDAGDARDISGHHHDGIVHGKPEWIPAIHGTGIRLDGREDWVEVAHSPELDLKENLTLTAWIKYSSVAGGFGSEILCTAICRQPTIPTRFISSPAARTNSVLMRVADTTASSPKRHNR